MENMYWQGSQDLFYEVLNLKPEVIRIFWCGEAVYPDLNLFDYAVCFDDFCGDRTMSRTYYFLEEIADIDSIKNNINFKKILEQKTKFCNFIYSNPDAHPMRDKIFYTLSKYKKVDSLGVHLKNVDIETSRYLENWREISVDMKKPYKFSIAAKIHSLEAI